jgi:hypothetical protein
MDALWGAETTRRVPLALAFVAGNVAESGLMAIGAVPREMVLGVILTPLVLGALMLPMALAVGGDDVFAGTLIAVLLINAVIYALVFAKDVAIAVDELVLSSQTLAALCVFATLAMPDGWDPAVLAGAAILHPWTTLFLAGGTIWAFVYAILRPRVPPLAAFATLEWFAFAVVICCWAALRKSDFDCLWPGAPLPESPLRSFAAGMAFFYLAFHATMILVPTFGWLEDRNQSVENALIDFVHVLENKVILRGAPRWIILACLALQAGTWALIVSRRLIPPSAVLFFVVLGFSHLFLIELKRYVSARDTPQ